MATTSKAPKSYPPSGDVPPAAQSLKGHQKDVFRAAFKNARQEYPDTKAGTSRAYATAIAAAEKASTKAPAPPTKKGK